MGKINLKVYKNKKTKYDCSELVQKITWSGRDGTPIRSITVDMIDSPKLDRMSINVIDGYYCIFKCDGDELFRGIITKTDQSYKGTMQFKAQDLGFRLTSNKDVFSYKNKKPQAIFRDICKRYNITVGKCCTCKKTIDEISKTATPWDVLEEAMENEYEKTGIRHAVYASEGKLNFIVRRENIVKWLLETDTNIIDWSYSRSIEKVKTRIKLYDSDNKTLAVAKDTSLEKKIGILQDVEKPDDDITSTKKLKELANSLLKESKNPEKILNITATGIPSMVTGRGAYVIIPDLSIKKSFYIVSDTHTFDKDKYTMKLKLQKTTDLEY